MSTPFHGIYPILYAFFGADGRLDEAAMRRQVRCCLAGGAHGIAVLGLATEVNKLSPAEKRDVVRWSAEELAGRVPLAVTVAEATVEEAASFVLDAKALGADWCILQPPPVRGLPEGEYVAWYGLVADRVGRRSDIPLGIQNAAAYIGVGLSPGGVAALARNHGNVKLIKAEDSAVDVQRLIEATGGTLTVFNGRAGLELPDCLRAGCAGMIPAPECADVQARVFDLMSKGEEAAAEAEYRRVLPLIAFAMQGVAMFLCYGKRVTAWRMGLEVIERPPALAPTPFGLDCARRFSAELGPYPGG